MANRIKLLLVEDEITLAGIIKDTLNGQGFDVALAHDGSQAVESLKRERPDIIVTDIMMPVMDGFTFVEHLRRNGSGIPVIFLSARSAAEDVVRGFELGARDYLRKPFAMSELIIRIRGLLERYGTGGNDPSTVYRLGSFEFDPAKSTLVKDGHTEYLSGKESEVLHYLVRDANRIISMKNILLDLWGDDSYFNARSLHVYIAKLRKKLAGDPLVSITNIRGVGYRLNTGSSNS
ncbi:MAG: response regulator transcription factor [Rikenellaceae bacterium]|nr:response regulator transcription factor [Rikenellaceae bacterium]